MIRLATLLLTFITVHSLFAGEPSSASDYQTSASSDGFFCEVQNPVIIQPPNRIRGTYSDASESVFLAAAFTPDRNQTVSKVCYYGGYVPLISGLPEDNFTIVYYLDEGKRHPGNLHAGPFSISPIRTETEEIIFLAPEYNFVATHPPVKVEGGTNYWVSIYNDTPVKYESWYWEFGKTDQTTGINQIAFRFDEDNWIPYRSGTTLAFSLGGADIVPTLSEWCVILLGLLILIFGVITLTQRQTTIHLTSPSGRTHQ